jgi:integrase/recombinase XerD
MIPLVEEFNRYLLAEKKLSPSSASAYCRDVNEFCRHMAERARADVKDAVQADLAAYVLELRQGKRASATISRKIASLRAFFKFMNSKSHCSSDPSVGIKTPKAQKRDIDYLSMEDVERLLAQPDSSVRGHRDKAVLELMYATGLRVSEVVEADLSHLNLRMGFITCTGDHGKARIIPLGRPARAALEEYIYVWRGKLLRGKTEESVALFLNYNGERLSRQGLWKILKNYAETAGIGKKITPQILRNSFAVHMLQNGADLKSLQELMGHEDMSATQAYLSVSRNHIKDVYDLAHPRAR